MDAYLLVLYVTREQELAIRLMFKCKKWPFRKKDSHNVMIIDHVPQDEDETGTESDHNETAVSFGDSHSAASENDGNTDLHISVMSKDTENEDLSDIDLQNGEVMESDIDNTDVLGKECVQQEEGMFIVDTAEAVDENDKSLQESTYAADSPDLDHKYTSHIYTNDSLPSCIPEKNVKNEIRKKLAETCSEKDSVSESYSHGACIKTAPEETELCSQSETSRSETIKDTKNVEQSVNLEETSSLNTSAAEMQNTDQMPSLQELESCAKCEVCGEVFGGSRSLRNHKIARHPEEVVYTCKFCNKTFSDRKSLVEHKKLQHSVAKTESSEVTCEVCDRAFSNKYGMQRHRRLQHTSADDTDDVGIGMFPCTPCKKTYKTIQGLQRHQKPGKCPVYKKKKNEEQDKHPDDILETSKSDAELAKERFICDICKKEFKTIFILRQHRKIHLPNDKRPFPCQLCSKGFYSKYDFTIHLRKHSGLAPFECEKCGKKFLCCSHLKKHRLTHLPSHLLPFQCHVCQRGFINKTSWIGHVRKHNGELPFQCNICSKRFPLESFLINHRKVVHEEKKVVPKTKAFVCDICNKAFPFLSYLKTHRKIHTEAKKYMCEVCGHAFRGSQHLKIHMRLHTGEKPYKCDLCERQCRTATALQSHRSRIHPEVQKPTMFPCDVCSKSFVTRGELTIHLRHHTGERPYKCDLCSKEFFSQQSLSAHKKLIHEEKYIEKPYTCEYCGKAFRQKCNLDNHRNIHLGIKKHICQFCGKGFVSLGERLCHERTHTGIKPYPCSYCGKAFAVSYNRTAHEKTHSTEKPFSCMVCGKAFKVRRALDKHNQTQHPENRKSGNVEHVEKMFH